jgi:hypothetical protein
MPDLVHISDMHICIPTFFALSKHCVTHQPAAPGTAVAQSAKMFQWKQSQLNRRNHSFLPGGLLNLMMYNLKLRVGRADIQTTAEKYPNIIHDIMVTNRNKEMLNQIFCLVPDIDFNNNFGLNTKNGSFFAACSATQADGTDNAGQFEFDDLSKNRRYIHPNRGRLINDLVMSGLGSFNKKVDGDPEEFLATQNSGIVRVKRNIYIPFCLLHSLLNQNIYLPPNATFTIEVQFPQVNEVDFFTNTLASVPGTWIAVAEMQGQGASDNLASGTNNFFDAKTPQTFDTFRLIGGTMVAAPTLLLASTDVNSPDLCIYMNAIVYQPEIINTINQYRISRPMLYNFTTYNQSTMINYSQYVNFYDCTVQINTGIPQMLQFYWMNTRSLCSGLPTFCTNVTMAAASTSVFFENCPLAVIYTRVILNKAGYNDYTFYNNYTFAQGSAVNAAAQLRYWGGVLQISNAPAGSNNFAEQYIQRLGVDMYNNPTLRYMEKYKKNSFLRADTSGKNGLDNVFQNIWNNMGDQGMIIEIPLNPSIQDIGIIHEDQKPYVIRGQFLLLDTSYYPHERMGLRQDYSTLYCVKKTNAQFTLAWDNSATIIVWPNVITGVNAEGVKGLQGTNSLPSNG